VINLKLNEILSVAANALNDKKAMNITAIKVGELTVIADYFLIATATSNTHVRALAEEVEEKLTAAGFEPDHVEGKATGWILLDYCGVVVHIFTRDTRDYYNLDRMWSDGEKIDLDSILTSAREE
jgi:ribosome-associated protein